MPGTLALALVASVLVLMVLTGLGQTRRGASALTAVVAGVAFPVTWMIWYLRDERPYADSHRRRTS